LSWLFAGCWPLRPWPESEKKKFKMSELRRDPLQKRWVIMARERNRRPEFMRRPVETQNIGFCPFCPGNEKLSKEIRRYDSQNGWQVRVVANSYPAMQVEGSVNRSPHGLFDSVSGIGAHEVVIETPEHNEDLPDWNREHSILVWKAYRERMMDLERDFRLRCIMMFKNSGTMAGAGLSHPHGQILASPVTPPAVEQMLDSAYAYFGEKERCLLCDMMAQELSEGYRIIEENESFVAWLPYASRLPFECWVAPRRHAHSFARARDEELIVFADFMKSVSRRLKQALGDFDYNLVLHTSPNRSSDIRMHEQWRTLELHYHWHIEILPRMWPQAGCEMGNGIFINPIPPEEAAAFLREV